MIKLRNPSLFNIGIKVSLFLILGFVLYYQIVNKKDFASLLASFKEDLISQPKGPIIIALLLMPINWGLEALKWSNLMRKFERIGFWKSFKGIMSGTVFSIITPQRIGEYAGRILVLESKNNWKGVMATFVCSISQNIVNICLGVIGMLFFVRHFDIMASVTLQMISFGALFFVILLLFIYYNVDLVGKVVKRIPMPKRVKPYARKFKDLEKFTSQSLSKALLIAFFRYCIYVTQYFLLLKFFGIEPGFFIAITGVAFIFLLQSSLPLPPLIGIIARGDIALFIWANFEANELSILASTFSLWIINLIIPALIGLIVVLNINVMKSLGYEKR